MILDTGSPWVWIMSEECKDCPSNVKLFEETTSSTFYFYDVVVDLHFGQGSVYGYNGID